MLEVERLCDFVVIMNCGRVVETGKPNDLIARYKCAGLYEAYLAIARREQWW